MNHTDKIYTNKKHILEEVDEVFKKAYEMGYEDGKKHNQDELDKEKQDGYDVGYKKGYEDGRHITEKFGISREPHDKGMNDAWELYKKLYSEISATALEEMFGGIANIEQLIKLYPPQVISKRIESYENKHKKTCKKCRHDGFVCDECDGFSKYEEDDTIESALKDCKLFKEQAQEDWDKADGGIVLCHIDTIIKALSSLGE